MDNVQKSIVALLIGFSWHRIALLGVITYRFLTDMDIYVRARKAQGFRKILNQYT
jgi:hypothetical protein